MITTIIAGIVGALLAVLTTRRCAKIGEKSIRHNQHSSHPLVMKQTKDL